MQTISEEKGHTKVNGKFVQDFDVENIPVYKGYIMIEELSDSQSSFGLS